MSIVLEGAFALLTLSEFGASHLTLSEFGASHRTLSEFGASHLTPVLSSQAYLGWGVSLYLTRLNPIDSIYEILVNSRDGTGIGLRYQTYKRCSD